MRFKSVLATLLGRRRRAAGTAEMLSLEEASGQALETMRRRRLPLARVALNGRSEGEARQWVANNMLQNATVLGRCPGSNTFESIPGSTRRRLSIRSDWSGAAANDDAAPVYQTLWIAQSELEAYLDWARSVA